jgi:hypothetical protein
MPGNAQDHVNFKQTVDDIKRQVTVGALYRHSKNQQTYRVLDIAIYSEDPEQIFVIYQGLYGENLVWARPWQMWNEPVEINGQTVSRFAKID